MNLQAINGFIATLTLTFPVMALQAESNTKPDLKPGRASHSPIEEGSSNKDTFGDDFPMRVTAARAANLVGAPRYADRSQVSTGATRVTFSREPVVVRGVSSRHFTSTAPVAGARLSSAFGHRRHPITGAWSMHSGVDLAAPLGTPVVAAQLGRVKSASWRGGYGLMVVLEHEGGDETRYAHLSQITVQPGQKLAGGETLGFVGATGTATGPHLHFERRSNGQAFNPVVD